MKDQNQIIASMKNGIGKTEPARRDLAAENPQAVSAMVNQMSKLFMTLKTHYTQYFMVIKSGDHEASMMKQWAADLVRSGVDREMLIAGIARAKSYASEDKFCKWPSVSDFISWCHKLPPAESAYTEACKNAHNIYEWVPIHPAVYLAGQEVTWYEFKNNNNERVVRSAFFKAYSEICARVIAGEVLEYEKPIQIERKRITKEEDRELKEIGRGRIPELLAMVGKRETEEKDTPAPEYKPNPKAADASKRRLQAIKDQMKKRGQVITEPTYNPNARNDLERLMQENSNEDPIQITHTDDKAKTNAIDRVDGCSALKAIREEIKK